MDLSRTTVDISIIFDVDGTLVDVTDSYEKTTLLTVYIYLKEIVGLVNLPSLDSWFSKKHIKQLKSIPGFNSDYTCATALINFVLEFLDPQNSQTTSIPFLPVKFPANRFRNYLNHSWDDYLRNTFTSSELSPIEVLINSKYSPLLKITGSIDNQNYLERIFQEIYFLFL